MPVSGAQSTTAGDNQIRASNLLFAEVNRIEKASFHNKAINFMMGNPSSVIASGNAKAQSNRGAPVTLIRDLSKNTGGDTVEMSLTHRLVGRPTMDNDYLEGKEELTTRSTYQIKIGLYRKAVGSGGSMDQQRRTYNLVKLGRVELKDYYPRLKSELMWYHLAGARGKYMADDMILPPMEPTDPQADAELAPTYVNPLLAPTYNRHFYAGGADSIDGSVTTELTTASQLDEETIERIAVELKEMSSPPRASQLTMQKTQAESDPFYFLFVTSRQMADFKRTATRYLEWVQNAKARVAGFNHPLFNSSGFMVENIYVTEYFCPIRWYEGDLVPVSNNDAAATVSMQQVPPGVTVDRAILVGAQALGMAIGATAPGRTFGMHKEEYDHGDKTRQSIKWMAGLKKVRFQNRQGWNYDYGTITLDTAVSNAPRPTYY